MASSISSKVVLCLRSFNALLTHPELAAHEAEVPQAAWQDELGRLHIWAANIGAHQTGQSSLDYRLRDASHISHQIMTLLEDMRSILAEIEEALADDPTLETECDEEEETEVQQLFYGLSNIIKCLYQMSMLIRKPARHDRLHQSHMDEIKAYQRNDRDHVDHKYPEADSSTVDRLGLAISRRRAELRYRERHHAKLSQGIEHAHDDARPETTSVILSQTIATDYKENMHVVSDDAASTSGLSQTSYAPSLMGGGAICVPPLPKEAAGEQPFQCPFCYFLIIIKNERSWTRHVFRDIMPYICVFPSCSTPNKMYDSRHEWFDHEMKAHLKPQMPSDAISDINCPLCNSVGNFVRLERHLARHLEELALFALPRSFSGEDEESHQSRNSLINADIALEDLSSISEGSLELGMKTPPSPSAGDVCLDPQGLSIKDKLEIEPPTRARRIDTTEDARFDSRAFEDPKYDRVLREAQDYPRESMIVTNRDLRVGPQDSKDARDIRDDQDELMPDLRNPRSDIHRDPRDVRDLRDDDQRYEMEIDRSSSMRRNLYFLPGEGIARAVIQDDICRYLGADATCKPCHNREGVPGYTIIAYRMLTAQMIEDLKEDTKRWEEELRRCRGRGFGPVRYGDYAREFRTANEDTEIIELPDPRSQNIAGYQRSRPPVKEGAYRHGTIPDYRADIRMKNDYQDYPIRYQPLSKAEHEGAAKNNLQ